jgi:hypothetical protein
LDVELEAQLARLNLDRFRKFTYHGMRT